MLTYNTGSMDAKLRIITHLPLAELFRDDGFSTVERGRSLSREDVRQVLTSGPVQFVVVDVGAAPRWIPEGDSFRFWEDEAKTHLASDAKVRLEEFLTNTAISRLSGNPIDRGHRLLCWRNTTDDFW